MSMAATRFRSELELKVDIEVTRAAGRVEFAAAAGNAPRSPVRYETC